MIALTFVSRRFCTLGSVGLLLALATSAWAQQAAPGPSSQQIIERLTPPPLVTRGIRIPSAAAGAAAPGPAASATSGAPTAAPGATAESPLPSIDLSIYFASGSAAITPQAESQLAALGKALTDPRLASYRFRLEGHTDTAGAAAMNQDLSERRAASVRDHLTTRFGIQPRRLMSLGFGESQLAVPTADNTPEPRNRRVTVVNIGG